MPQMSQDLVATILSCPADRARLKAKDFPATTPSGFKVHRKVGNFQLVDENQGDAPVRGISTVELKVNYTRQDLNSVNNDKTKLVLGVFMKRATDQNAAWQLHSWSALTDNNASDAKDKPGSVTVEITGDLSDPPVAWGSGGGG